MDAHGPSASLDCPVCGAGTQTAIACRRCKADLAPLLAIEAARQRLLADAVRFMARRRLKEAGRAARQAHQLRRGADSRRLVEVVRRLRRAGPAGDARPLADEESCS